MFEPSRAEARRLFFDAWQKHRARQPLTPLQAMALDVALLHPEYHAMLDDPDSYLDRDYQPEGGDTNPFLHMSLHLAIREQLSIDQPPGICAAYANLLQAIGEEHAALHRMLDCLAEVLWRAERTGTPPDGRFYLDCLSGP